MFNKHVEKDYMKIREAKLGDEIEFVNLFSI